MSKGINQKITERIESARPGTIFLTRDFIDITNTTTARQCLGRQVSAGNLKRVMNGVYEKPHYSKLLNRIIPTDPDAVAKSIAKGYNWTIAPCGDLALNRLGLSTQIPVTWTYISTGPYREYEFDNIRIEFKHRTNRGISNVSPVTTMLIEAIRTLGEQRIDGEVISRLRTTVKPYDANVILEEAQNAPAWIYEIIRKVCDRS